MIETDADRLRADYLSRLDDAMRTLPHGVAAEIRAGIVEELEGLDAAATAARIAQLGDPLGIAREAQDEVPGSPIVVVAAPAPAPAAPTPAVTTTRGFAIAAALTLGFGGFLVPFIGWVVGVVLVCFSTLWRTGEKIVAILVPLLGAAVSFLVSSTFTAFGSFSESGSSTGSGVGEGVNPLVPGLGGWHLLLLLGFLLVPASGLWLLWRLRGRTER